MAKVTCTCGKCGAQQIKYRTKSGSWKKGWIGGEEKVPEGEPEPTEAKPKPLPTIQEKRRQEAAQKPQKVKPASVEQPPAEEAPEETSGAGWVR